MSDEPEKTSRPIMSGSPDQIGVRLEALLGGLQPGFQPESLKGYLIEMRWPDDKGVFRGRVLTVEPYVDELLGPGHWLTVEPT